MFPTTTSAYNARELFALRVKGESMIEVGIFEGDILHCQRTQVARNGGDRRLRWWARKPP
jgi:repressor LexA